MHVGQGRNKRQPAVATVDVDTRCPWCSGLVTGVDDAGRLLTDAGPGCGGVGSVLPHDTRVADSGVAGNPDLGWLAVSLYETDAEVRDGIVLAGGDPENPDDPDYRPFPTIASAWRTWADADDTAHAGLLRVGDDLTDRVDRIAQAERDLALLLRTTPRTSPLEDLIRLPALI